MWLNWRDDKIDDGSSSGTVDEGHRGVAVDDVVGEEAPAVGERSNFKIFTTHTQDHGDA